MARLTVNTVEIQSLGKPQNSGETVDKELRKYGQNTGLRDISNLVFNNADLTRNGYFLQAIKP